MARRLIVIITVFIISSIILLTSIFRTASVRYTFKLPPTPLPINDTRDINIAYNLPYPGRVGPGHILWPLEVLRDKLWLAITINPLKKAEIALLLADKRVASAQSLFSESNTEEGVSALSKSAMYLNNAQNYADKARETNMQTVDIYRRLSLASLKHRQVMETILIQAPEDARPIIIQIMDSPKNVYEKSVLHLREQNQNPPENPFESS